MTEGTTMDNPLEHVRVQRAAIAKKIADYESLVLEDRELEVAERVLVKMAYTASPLVAKPSPGAEQRVFDALIVVKGQIEQNDLYRHVSRIPLSTFRSVLSRLKGKGLIERNGTIIMIKESPAEAGQSQNKAQSPLPTEE